MFSYDDRTYGERIAEAYDDLYAPADAAALDLLQRLAAGGRVLELGIGTGRYALPLQARGLEVTGVDASPEMLAKLRAKPGGTEVRTVEAGFGRLRLGERFDLVFVVFNTFFALRSQAEQVECFRSVAEHLSGRGVFLLECFVPDLARFDRGQSVRATQIDDRGVQLEVSRHDPVEQMVTGHTLLLSEKGVRFFPVQLRYAWPAELDLMARLAGLTLRARWGSWRQDDFSAASQTHVSVYAAAAG